jgi:hypothetical protein
VVVVNYLNLGEDFTAAELIYLMSKGVGGCVGLQSQLQLGNCLLLEGNLESNVRDRGRIVESALYLNQSVVTGVIFDELLDLVYGCDDILDGSEYALSPNHVADCEGN